jgi:thiosulfate dehydrogenase
MKVHYIVFLFVIALIVTGYLLREDIKKYFAGTFNGWPKHDINSLPDDSTGKMIRYGHTLIVETSNIVGPDVENVSMRFSGNHLQCQNCHFTGGQEKNTMSYIGVANRYPAFSKRHNRISDLTERVEDCFERSMNGRKLPRDSYELNSLLAYMEWLSKDTPKDLEGVTINDIEFPKRDPDTEKGRLLFDNKCITCHAQGGLGILHGPREKGGEKYLMPPLSGDDSFNDGAGMSRMERLVKFLKTQMPRNSPGSLTLDEAYDIAGYVSSMKRPKFDGVK